MTFLEKYAALENKFKDKIKEENEIFGWKEQSQSYYLPNVEPEGPAAFVLVGMEPSSSARTNDGKQKTPRNFTLTVEDFILHYCVRNYLCRDGQTYHITDIAKGATLTDQAKKVRTKRWPMWAPLLEAELDLVAKDAVVIAVGGEVERFLCKQKISQPHGSIFHYSRNNATARTIAPQLVPDQYRKFKLEVGIDDIVGAANDVMRSSIFDGYRDEIVRDVRKSGLTESGKMLMFTYQCLFAVMDGRSLSDLN